MFTIFSIIINILINCEKSYKTSTKR